MHLKIVNEIIDYTQNLGSSEDIVTALLAISLSYSPSFADNLFSELGIPIIKRNEYDEYFIDTGFSINSKSYAWISEKDNSVNFRPDIMVSRISEWTDEIPKGEQLILFESKLWAQLEDKQANSYEMFKEVCRKSGINKVYNVFISLDELGNSLITKKFDIAITWNQVIGAAHKVIEQHNNFIEQQFLEEVFCLMEMRLKPDKDEFVENGNINCKIVLQKLKYRILSYSSTQPKKPKDIDSYYNDIDNDPNYDDFFKKFNLSKKCQMSFLEISTAKEKMDINCAINLDNKIIIWYEKINKDNEEYGNPQLISQIDMEKPYWHNVWYDTLKKISQLLESF